MARIILETILGRPLKDISVQGQRVFYGSSPQKHGIRLDALITEATGDVSGNVIYDLEEDPETISMIVHVVEKRPDDMMDHIDEYVEEILAIVNSSQNT